MRDTYPYLKDPRALAEIRRHKWIESQKAGREVGFATAAVDWITKYGQEWKRICGVERGGKEIFLERRRYRRFPMRGIVRFVTGGLSVAAEPLDLSFFGMLCRARGRVTPGGRIRALMSVDLRLGRRDLNCYGRIERIAPFDADRYDIFFAFDENCRETIENAFAA